MDKNTFKKKYLDVLAHTWSVKCSIIILLYFIHKNSNYVLNVSRSEIVFNNIYY